MSGGDPHILEDDALSFFNDVYSLVPDQYKQVPKDFLETSSAPKQNGKHQKKD